MCDTNLTANHEATAAARPANYKRLIEHYRASAAEQPETPARFALVMIESQEATSDNYIATHNTFADACALAGEEILDSGRLPHAVYDLDTGRRIELHTTTPVVTHSEDQGMMLNPLEDRGPVEQAGTEGTPR
jgi:hypothetical protein